MKIINIDLSALKKKCAFRMYFINIGDEKPREGCLGSSVGKATNSQFQLKSWFQGPGGALLSGETARGFSLSLPLFSTTPLQSPPSSQINKKSPGSQPPSVIVTVLLLQNQIELSSSEHLFLKVVHTCPSTSNCILNMYDFLYINYTSIRLYLT